MRIRRETKHFDIEFDIQSTFWHFVMQWVLDSDKDKKKNDSQQQRLQRADKEKRRTLHRAFSLHKWLMWYDTRIRNNLSEFSQPRPVSLSAYQKWRKRQNWNMKFYSFGHRFDSNCQRWCQCRQTFDMWQLALIIIKIEDRAIGRKGNGSRSFPIWVSVLLLLLPRAHETVSFRNGYAIHEYE